MQFNIQLFMIILILLLLLTQIQTINQVCNQTNISLLTNNQNPRNHFNSNVCPLNSHCLNNNYCACDGGYVGGCTQEAYQMQDGTLISTTVTNLNYTFFSITQDVDSYVILIFQICHKNSSSINQTIDVWEDKGNIDILNKSNALVGGKDWEIKQGCLKLSTPLLLFEKQTNGEAEVFVLGIKLTAEGSISLTLQLQIDTIDFWDLFMKFLFIIGGIFLLIFIITLAIFIYKWRRRGLRVGRSQDNDISHFSNFMPRYKLSEQNRYRTHEQNCAVCLLELGEDQWLRKTICGHVFHQECLDQWCKSNLNCPMCRHSFELKHFGGDLNINESSERSNGLRNPLIQQN